MIDMEVMTKDDSNSNFAGDHEDAGCYEEDLSANSIDPNDCHQCCYHIDCIATPELERDSLNLRQD